MDVDLKDITPGVCEVRDKDGLLLGLMVRNSKKYEYNKVHAEIICDRIATGESITKICKEPNMPSYGSIMAWVKNNEDFAEMYQMAKMERADSYFDRVLDEADDALGATKDTIAINKLRSDTYKWAASVSKPTEYGNKTTIKGELGALTIKVETGIRRPGDEIIEAAKEVKEITDGSKKVSEDKVPSTTTELDGRRNTGADLFD
jgi:hypothetical protein